MCLVALRVNAVQMGGRLAWNSIKVYKEAKFGAATRALVRRGVGELADPVVVADLKVCGLIAQQKRYLTLSIL